MLQRWIENRSIKFIGLIVSLSYIHFSKSTAVRQFMFLYSVQQRLSVQMLEITFLPEIKSFIRTRASDLLFSYFFIYLFISIFIYLFLFAGQQGKGKAISLTPLYHFSRRITAERSPLHNIAGSWIPTRATFGFWSQITNH